MLSEEVTVVFTRFVDSSAAMQAYNEYLARAKEDFARGVEKQQIIQDFSDEDQEKLLT